MMTNNEILSALGPLAPLYADPKVIEIMVDAPDRVLVERGEDLVLTDVRFESAGALRQVIDVLMSLGDVRLEAEETIGDVRLEDGAARALAVLPPTALHGPYLVIRKLQNIIKISWEDLISWGSVSQAAYDFICQAVRVPVNMLVTGGTGSGKTTVMNRIAETIPQAERLVVAEAYHELQVKHPGTVYLEAGGPAGVSMDELLSTAAKMRPDWLVVSELIGAEALRVMELFGRGFAGLTTMHANSPEDALARLETLCLTANLGLGIGEIRALIASGLQLITFQRKLPKGGRKMLDIVEICGIEDDRYLLQPLFRFNPETEILESTGLKPTWK